MLMYKLKRTNGTVPKCFRETALKYPNKDAILSDSVNWTFKQLDQYSNQVANFLIAQGLKKGDEISLLMEGRPEFIGMWLGAAKAGIVTAFINTSLKGSSLIHSITVIQSKALIFTPTTAQQVKEIVPSLLAKSPKMAFYLYTPKGSTSTTANIFSSPIELEANNNDEMQSSFTLNEMDEQSLAYHSNEFSLSQMTADFADKLFYVYTSGTTGLPKAAIIRHARFIFLGTGANFLIGLKPHDVIYTAIPLYHMAGGALGTCQMLIHGSTLAIREKFSVSNFWSDCIKYKCTAAQYIGEICRYLLLQENKKLDNLHNVKIMFGNGLRPNIWKEFKDRFNIKKIVEFYGATEGNANVVNYRGKEGSCGFISRILPRSVVNMIYPVSVMT